MHARWLRSVDSGALGFVPPLLLYVAATLSKSVAVPGVVMHGILRALIAPPPAPAAAPAPAPAPAAAAGGDDDDADADDADAAQAAADAADAAMLKAWGAPAAFAAAACLAVHLATGANRANPKGAYEGTDAGRSDCTTRIILLEIDILLEIYQHYSCKIATIISLHPCYSTFFYLIFNFF
jgi:hypothetical protein